MKDVRAQLAVAFQHLHEIATGFDLKSESLPQDQIEDLVLAIKSVEDDLHEAALRAAGYVTVELYAIGKESAPGEYEGFTNGPVPQRELMEQATDQLEDGDCLVRIVQQNNVINHVTEAIWLDGVWNETGDTLPGEKLKELTA